MKAKNLIVTGFILIAGCLSMSVSAQENIIALIEKCRTMENMEVNVVCNKNKETKKIEKEVVTVLFKNNEALVKEFIAAFYKDKDAAFQEIENFKNGLKDFFYRYDKVSCSFSQNEKGSASISIIQDDNFNKISIDADAIKIDVNSFLKQSF
jgi:hypothetical protein